MNYEGLCTVSHIAGQAFAKGDIGKPVAIENDGGNGKVVLTRAATDSCVGVLAQDGPFADGDVVPVAELRGKVPVRFTVAVTPGLVATLTGAAGATGHAANLGAIATGAMGLGVILDTAGAGELARVAAAPLAGSA